MLRKSGETGKCMKPFLMCYAGVLFGLHGYLLIDAIRKSDSRIDSRNAFIALVVTKLFSYGFFIYAVYLEKVKLISLWIAVASCLLTANIILHVRDIVYFYKLLQDLRKSKLERDKAAISTEDIGATTPISGEGETTQEMKIYGYYTEEFLSHKFIYLTVVVVWLTLCLCVLFVLAGKYALHLNQRYLEKEETMIESRFSGSHFVSSPSTEAKFELQTPSPARPLTKANSTNSKNTGVRTKSIIRSKASEKSERSKRSRKRENSDKSRRNETTDLSRKSRKFKKSKQSKKFVKSMKEAIAKSKSK